MGMYTFLNALPAILGITGFFVYLWAGQSRIGGEIFRQIVSKLRASPNLEIGKYASLTPAKIGKLVKSDERVREVVNEQDQKLLRLLVIFQHVLTIVVLVVCAGMVALSVWLISRPEPLAIVVKAPKAVVAEAEDVLVDLDPIVVEWTSTGRDEPVAVYLENVDSGSRTPKRSLASNVRSVRFEPAEVHQVATRRGYRESNRIRAVIEWSENRGVSEIRDLAVGIRVGLLLFGRLITPNGQRKIHTLIATIDRSTETVPEDYCFTANLVGWTKTNVPLVIALRSCNDNGEVRLPSNHQIDWSRHIGLVYGGPDDLRIVRTSVSGAPL